MYNIYVCELEALDGNMIQFQPQPVIKPKDPDEYQFNDEQLEKDYRKMYDKFQEMEAMLKDHPEMDPVSNEQSMTLSYTMTNVYKKEKIFSVLKVNKLFSL